MILALDLGIHVAFSAGAMTGDIISGRFDLPSPVPIGKQFDFGHTSAAFADRMLTLLGDIQPRAIYAEAPFIMSDVRSAMLIPFLTLRVGEIAFRRRIPFTLVHVGTVRSWFCRGIPRITGDGAKVKEDARVNLACVKRGWTLPDEHQRDSRALWAWAHAHQKAAAA